MSAVEDAAGQRMPRHDHGCTCWPHVSEKEALALIADVATLEYREGRDGRSAAYDDGWERGRADLAARIEERVAAYASDTKAMEPNEWIEVADVLAIVREEAAK